MQTPTENTCLAPYISNISYVPFPTPLSPSQPPTTICLLALIHLIFSLLKPHFWYVARLPGPGPWAVFYPVFLCFFLSAPLPGTFWLLRPELSCQSSAWPPEGNLRPANWRKVKTKQNNNNKIPEIFEIGSVWKVKTGKCWVCKITSPTVLERTLQIS